MSIDRHDGSSPLSRTRNDSARVLGRGGVGFVRVMYKTGRAARISFGNDGGGLARDADLVIRE